MTAKEYLNQYQVSTEKIRQLELEIATLHSKATSTSMAMDGERVQSSGSGDKLSSLVTSYLSAEETLIEKRKECQRIRDDIINTIHNTEDERFIKLLYARYIQRHSFERIAVDMNYSYDHVVRVHGWALEKIGNIMPCDVG